MGWVSSHDTTVGVSKGVRRKSRNVIKVKHKLDIMLPATGLSI